MRIHTFCLAVGLVAACTDEPGAQIIAPLSNTTVVATVELRMTGQQLTGTTQTKLYVDLEHYTGELVHNTLPAECDAECSFVIAFAGASIPNGPHTVAVFFFDGDVQLASDAVPLTFAR